MPSGNLAETERIGAVDAVVVGASSFGRLHVRELAVAGRTRIGIVGRSSESAAATVEKLGGIASARLIAFPNLDAALDARPPIFTICTPPQTHLEFLDRLATSGAHVFCEKPFFWDAALDPASAEARARDLFARFEGRLLVDHLNVVFGAALRAAGQMSKRRLDFAFAGARPSDGFEIGIDLLPHAVSVMCALLGDAQARHISVRKDMDAFRAEFDWGEVRVSFDLSRAPGPSVLEVACDGRKWTRRQALRADGSMDVWLEGEGAAPLPVENPLRRRFGSFVAGVANGRQEPAACEEACRTVRICYELLKAA